VITRLSLKSGDHINGRWQTFDRRAQNKPLCVKSKSLCGKIAATAGATHDDDDLGDAIAVDISQQQAFDRAVTRPHQAYPKKCCFVTGRGGIV